MKNLMKNSFPAQAKHFALNVLSASLLLTIGNSSIAAPGTPSNSPLFLSNKVQPNIFFMIDDSGSMDWADLLNTGAPVTNEGALLADHAQFNPPVYDPRWNRLLRRLACPGFNLLAYDPGKTYIPWAGTDNAGNPYPNMVLASARNNPYLATGGTEDLRDQLYWVWTDSDGDGEYDGPPSDYIGTVDPFFPADNLALPRTAASQPGNTNDECGMVTNNGGGIPVSSLTAAQQTNYANWYSYYRKREYVTKRALSQLITESSSRMGLATINAQNNNSLTGNSNDIFSPVADVDNISTPVNATAVTNKNNLLRSLFRIDSNRGTPLRNGLQRVGRYFENLNPNGWGATPILNAANGGECQQNFSVLMTDGHWNGGTPNVNDADTDNNSTYDGGLYADGVTNANTTNTLADVAMHYYERDLRTGLANKVPTQPGIDDNNTQHMVTYTVAFGKNGLLDSSLMPGDAGFAWPAPLTGWPTPQQSQITTIDDLQHAAYNGRGKFLSAKDPQQLIDSLNTAIKDIAARTASASAVTFNSTNLQTNSKVLRASFDSDRWSGELSAYSLSLDTTTKLLSVSPTPAWQASTDLNARTADSRTIVTYDAVTNSGVNFDWSTITASQKNDLRTNATGTQDNDATGMARLDFIRGYRNCEQGSATTATCSYTDSGGNTYNSKSLRQRNSALGDIVHSSPTFIGKPSNRYPNNIESTPYSNFTVANASRMGMTYVGSNDGMLHAFNDSGREVFAYIPSMLFSTDNGAGFHHLTESGYVHEYYVDLSTFTADAYFNNGSSTGWHTALVGGLRGGGKGVFAMDVTNPASMSTANGAKSKILWEFTHDELGYSFSEIRIARMNNGKWAAIFGNGYNNDPAGDGESKLFIVYLDGSNVSTPIILETGVGSMVNNDCGDSNSDCNGMSTPTTADINGDGSVDLIYAGDLHGNLWSFDVSSSNTSNWASAYGSGITKTPLFRACNSTPCTNTNRQPITSKPTVTRHPFRRDITTSPNLMVFLGTGQYLTSTDNTSTAQQSFYGVWDSGTGDKNRSNLTSQTLTDTTTGGFDVRKVTDNNVDYTTTKKGWLIDFPTQKERVVTDSVKFGDLIFFNTMIPSTGPCEDGGYGWRMALDFVNGGVPDFIPIDVNNDGTFDASDKIGSDIAIGTKSGGIPAAPRFIGNYRVDNDTGSGNASTTRTQPKGPAASDRMSWTGLEKK